MGNNKYGDLQTTTNRSHEESSDDSIIAWGVLCYFVRVWSFVKHILLALSLLFLVSVLVPKTEYIGRTAVTYGSCFTKWSFLDLSGFVSDLIICSQWFLAVEMPAVYNVYRTAGDNCLECFTRLDIR